MESFDLAHVCPPASGRIYAVLVHNPRNAAAVLDNVKRGDIAIPCAMLDAQMLTSMDHLLVAVHQAVLREASGTLKTKTVHSEIIWNLSTTSNIMESFRTFGLSERTRNLVVVHVQARTDEALQTSARSVLEQIKSVIDGDYDDRGPSETLNAWRRGVDASPSLTDWEQIKKAYKLSDGELAGEGGIDDAEISASARRRLRERIDALVTSTVAVKFVAS